MTDTTVLARRLAAVERTLVEGERGPADLPDAAAVADDIDRLESRFDDLERRVAELEGATQALRGYVGNVRSVEEAVERRADVAVATVDRLDDRVASIERTVEGCEIEFEETGSEPREGELASGASVDDRSAVDLPARARSTDGGREERAPSDESGRRSTPSGAKDRERTEETIGSEERSDSPLDEAERTASSLDEAERSDSSLGDDERSGSADVGLIGAIRSKLS